MGEESECTPLLGSPPQPRRSAARESQVLEPIITIQWGWCMSGQIADVKKMFRTQQGWSMLCWAQHQHIIWYWPFCLPGTLDILYLFARLKMDQWLRAVHCSKCNLIAWYQIWLSILLCVIQYDYWAQSDDTPLRRQKDHKIVIFLPSQFCLRPLSIEPPLYIRSVFSRWVQGGWSGWTESTFAWHFSHLPLYPPSPLCFCARIRYRN